MLSPGLEALLLLLDYHLDSLLVLSMGEGSALSANPLNGLDTFSSNKICCVEVGGTQFLDFGFEKLSCLKLLHIVV